MPVGYGADQPGRELPLESGRESFVECAYTNENDSLLICQKPSGLLLDYRSAELQGGESQEFSRAELFTAGRSELRWGERILWNRSNAAPVAHRIQRHGFRAGFVVILADWRRKVRAVQELYR